MKPFKMIFVFLIILICLFNTAIADNTVDVGNGDNSGYIPGNMLDNEDADDGNALSQSSHIDLTTEVPATVEVFVVGPGTVINGGKTYGNNSTIKTTDMTFRLSPNKGYRVSAVYWNSVDVTSMVKNGVLKLSNLEGGVLKIVYVEINNGDEEKQSEEEKNKGGEAYDHKRKSKSYISVNTDDDFVMLFCPCLSMLLSTVGFVLTLMERRSDGSAGRGGRRYRS